MTALFDIVPPALLLAAFGVACVAGVVKGMVGFAMPMILVSGLGIFLEPELALAGLILPTLATNGFQALGQGRAAAMESIRRYWVFLSVGGVFLIASAQLVRVVPMNTLLLLIGLPVTVFVLIQLLGWGLTLRNPSRIVEAGFAVIAGAIGGFSGIWGPPTVMYLTALDTPKAEQIRIQGVIYGLGSVVLVVAHVGSGVLRWQTVPFSLALVIPALAGMWVGIRLRNRIDQATFRRVTLLVLLIAGLNLIRRGLVG